MPMHVCPALVSPPQTAADTAASRSASESTIIASLPPHSSSTGVSCSAHCAMIRFPVRVDPVNAILSTPAVQRNAPTSPLPWTICATGCSGTTSANVSTRNCPTAGVYSLGLKTTAFPAARAYATEPIGVKIG